MPRACAASGTQPRLRRVADPILGTEPGPPVRISTFSPIDIMPELAREFLGRRLAELAGLLLLLGVGAVSLALVTWSIRDPSWNHAASGAVHNLAGPAGAIVADLIMQLVGIAIVAILPPVFCWGLALLSRRRLDHARLRLILLAVGGCGATALASSLPTTDRWPCRVASAASSATASSRCRAGCSAMPNPP